MSIGSRKTKMHYELTNVGLRAQATAAGLVQLCRELKDAGVLSEDALSRVKHAIASEIAVLGPRPRLYDTYHEEVCKRLDLIFSGEIEIGTGDDLPFAPAP